MSTHCLAAVRSFRELAVGSLIGLVFASATLSRGLGQEPPVREIPPIPLEVTDGKPRESDLRSPRAAQLLRPLADIQFRVTEATDEPTDYASKVFATASSLEPAPEVLMRSWAWTQTEWTPSAVWHNPLYFEDVNLERYGLTFGVAQPAVSATHFLGNAVAWPYHMVQQHPHACVYDLGHGRPGDCVPFYCHHDPFDVAAGLAEAGTIVGLVLLFP